MTVRELIELLKQCNPDFMVTVEGEHSILDVDEVKSLTHPEENRVALWC